MALVSDSICVKVLDENKILVGIGNRLAVCDDTKSSFFPLHARGNFHKIAAKKAGSEIFEIIAAAGRQVIYLVLDGVKLQSHFVCNTNDWVCNLHILENHCEFAYLDKHNQAVHAMADVLFGEVKVLNKSRLLDKVTNYSSIITGGMWNESLIFCGTALGELICWSPKSNPGQILHKMKAHNGVIFSIDQHANILITSSDDRSLKIWNLNKSKDGGCVIEDGKALFGHTARIFCCKLFVRNGKTYIVSAGEDGTICVWDLNGSDRLTDVWKRKCKMTIWSVDFDPATDTIYASTCIGTVHKYKFKPIIEKKEVVFPEIVDSSAIAKFKHHSTGKVALFKDCSLIVYLDPLSGCAKFQLGPGCNLLQTLDDLIVATWKTKLVVIEVDDGCDYEDVDLALSVPDPQFKMIRSLHILSKSEVIFCTDAGLCCLLNVSTLTLFGPTFLLPNSSERYTTAALKFGEYVLLADRIGSLHLYLIKKDSNNQTVLNAEHSIKRLHGKMGITNILFDSISRHFYIFRTTGRDGSIKTLAIDRQSNQLVYWSSEKIPIAWVERVIVRPMESLLLFGFNGNCFVGYRLGADDLLFEYECGGGHREWDFNYKDDKLEFAFVYRGRLKLKFFDIDTNWFAPTKPSNANWHTDSVNVMETVNFWGQTYFLTGSDDNTMKITALNPDLSLSVVKTMYQHVSMVKCLKICDGAKSNEKLIISAGGRSQICLTTLTYDQYLYHQDEGQYMLHLTDKERKQLGVAQDVNFNPETRFMCLDLLEVGDGTKKLYAGCSDGFIRIYSITDSKTNGYTIKPVGQFYYGRCILNLKLLKISETLTVIATMSTDGLVCFYKVDRLCDPDTQPFFGLRHHESGINCYDFLKIDDDFYLATGGDDQGITMTRFRISPTAEFEVVNTRNTTVQGAQVTGVKFVGGKLVSASVDLTVVVLTVPDLQTVRRHTTCIADIKGLRNLKRADIDYTIVYGQGLDMIEI